MKEVICNQFTKLLWKVLSFAKRKQKLFKNILYAQVKNNSIQRKVKQCFFSLSAFIPYIWYIFIELI